MTLADTSENEDLGQKPTDAWTFGRAVLSRAWTYYVYGGGAGALLVCGAVIRQVPPWLYLALIPVAVLVSGFLTWQEETRRPKRQGGILTRAKRRDRQIESISLYG